jgi:hypothetical protein
VDNFFDRHTFLRNHPDGEDDAFNVHVHPIFDTSNFMTKLPMDEIREVLLPALQLASMFISDAAALEWFVHVRYARWVDLEDGEAKLVRDSKTFTRAQTKTVQAELLRLAPRLRIFWFDGMYDAVPSEWSEFCGRAMPDLLELFRSYKSKPYGQAFTKKFDRGGF